MIDLYGMPSPNVLKVILMLEEVGLTYRLHHVNVIAGDQHTPEFRALNPNGKVPALVDPDGPGGHPFTAFESGAILMYLADKTGLLWPPNLRERHIVSQWLMFQMAGIGPMFGQFMHFTRFAPPGSDYGVSRYTTEARRLYGVLDTRLGESPYLGGVSYSIADVATWPWASGYSEFIGIALDTHPNLKRWIRQIEARPAVARMRERVMEITPPSAEAFRNAQPDQLDRFLGRGKFASKHMAR